MSQKRSPNWLIFFTIALFIAVLAIFIVTFRDQFRLKNCVYGGEKYTVGQSIPGEQNCFCSENGEVVCKGSESEASLETGEYINDDLEFSSSFLNFLDIGTNFESVRFDEVSTVEKGLEIVVERLSKCKEDEDLPPQIGYYMFDEDDLYLTTSTNLLDEDYSEDCMVSNTFLIYGLSEVSNIYYQSEDDLLIEADICIYGGRVFNKGDAFVGDDGEVIVCE